MNPTAIQAIEGVTVLAAIAFAGFLHYYGSFANLERAVGQWLCRDSRRREHRAAQRAAELHSVWLQEAMESGLITTRESAACCIEARGWERGA